MSTLTIYLARLIGLSAVLLVVALLVRGNALIMATVADGPVMLVYAIFSLAAGLAIILGHNVWSGGTLPVIVTLVGWLIFVKGLVLMLITPETLSPLLERMQQHYHYPVYVVPALIIGLYLIYAGFAAPIFEDFLRPAKTTKEIDVAKAVWKAVNDTTAKLRFPAGSDARALFGAC